MTPFELLAAVVVLAIAVTVGTVVHEFAHAAALRSFGVPFEIEWLHGGEGSVLAATISGTWASVTPRPNEGLPPWNLRLAAITPLALLLPLALVPLGAVSNPFSGGGVYLQLAVIGWLACAIPSPQDFSLFWHAEEAIEGELPGQE